MDNTQDIKDPSTTGVGGLKGLEGIKRLKEKGIELNTFALENAGNRDAYARFVMENSSPVQEVGFVGINDSKLDKDINSFTQLEDLANTRGELQPWYDQIMNGVVKSGITAGTTFINNTLGLATGLISIPLEQRGSALWDNPVTKAMAEVSEWSEKVLPNYYTNEEKENEWYENILSPNFIGDKLIKNLGFTAGAFYSGGVFSKLATSLATVAGAGINTTRAIATGVGTVTSAVGEGSIEALQNADDWYNFKLAELQDLRAQKLEELKINYAGEIPNVVQRLEELQWEESLKKLEEDKLKVGNFTLLGNLPILTASNIFQFGKLYAGGFKTSRKVNDIIKNSTEYATNKNIKKGLLTAAISPLSEGSEEMAQKMVSTSAGLYYENDTPNFYLSKIDPEAEKQTIGFMQAFAKGINETLNEGSSWEEFTIGALTGALGMPRIQSFKNSEGKFQSPLTFDAGIVGQYKDYKKDLAREQELVNYLNKTLQDPKFINNYQGLIRHFKFENDMKKATANDSEFDYKNAEFGQLISDITMFDNAGKLDDLYAMIDTAYDTSDANLQSIIDNTTSSTTDAQGKEVKVGPFIDKNGFMMNATEGSKQQMIEKINTTRDSLRKTVDEYIKIKDSIDRNTKEVLSDEQLQELTWLKAQRSNWMERSAILAKEVKPFITKLIGENTRELWAAQEDLRQEGMNNKDVTESYQKQSSDIKKKENLINNLQTLVNLSDKDLSSVLNSKQGLTEDIKNLLDYSSEITADEVAEVSTKLEDILKLEEGLNSYNVKLKEYIQNPGKLSENIEKTKEKVATIETDNNIKTFKEKLNNATNINEFRTILNNEKDPSIKQETLKQLREEKNPLFENYKNVEAFNSSIKKHILNSDTDNNTKDSALGLLNSMLPNMDKLEDFMLLNEHDFDLEDIELPEELSYEEKLERLSNAQQLLRDSVDTAKEEQSFSKGFSPQEKGGFLPKTDSSEDASKKSFEDSLVTTAGSEEEIKSDIEALNASSDKEIPNKNYYRPAIPELHIDSAKTGVFVPFNEQAKALNPNLNFDVIYNYLENAGAFKYLNENKLSKGDKIGFMVDPNFTNPHSKDITIFMIDSRNNQIVGSLDESESSLQTYPGLRALRNKIKEEYKNYTPTSDNPTFISNVNTRVAEMMNGKIVYTYINRSIKSIIGENNGNYKLAIVKNGRLVAGEGITSSDIMNPLDLSTKEGRVYLLIKNAKGKYSPVGVRVKHFNKNEFNFADPAIQSTPLFKIINTILDEVSKSTDSESLAASLKELKKYVYLGDVHITHHGDRIRISKTLRNPNGTVKKTMYQGREVNAEVSSFINIKDSSKAFVIGEDNKVQNLEPVVLDPSQIKERLVDILQSFNLPIQINAGQINTGDYNLLLANSDVLFTNIEEMQFRSNWFVTDYFDDDLKLQEAVVPKKKVTSTTPVDGKESALVGTQVIFKGNEYYVDGDIITNNNGRRITSFSAENQKLIKDIAFANKLHGNSTSGNNMWNNKILIQDRILDRTTNTYLSGEAYTEAYNQIVGNTQKIKKTEAIIEEIYKDQIAVNKEKTDQDFYYITEDDGKEYKYPRIHSVLDSPIFQESKSILEKRKDIEKDLLEVAHDNNKYNNLLNNLGLFYKVNLSSYHNKSDAASRKEILETIITSIKEGIKQAAFNKGNTVDTIVRQFFTSNNPVSKPSNITEAAFKEILDILTEMRSTLEKNGHRFFANNIVLYHKFADGTRIAGELDILAVDSKGNFYIYDIKTSARSFYYNGNPSPKPFYNQQLSGYVNLFESHYKTPISKMALMPFVLESSIEVDAANPIITKVTKEAGIILAYDKNIPVPNEFRNPPTSSNQKQKTDSNTPELLIFDVTGITDYIDQTYQEAVIIEKKNKAGFYIEEEHIGGKITRNIVRTALVYIGDVAGVPIHVAKKGEIASEGRTSPEYVLTGYNAIFPNGESINIIKSASTATPFEEIENKILAALQSNPEKVKEFASKPTELSNFTALPTAKVDGINLEENKSKLDTNLNKIINTPLSSKRKKIIRDREVTDNNAPKFDKNKELQWLEKVLPQLSEDERILFVKGLINVANSGTKAWGQFNNGMVLLSDEAAVGTVYHEAFHVVFNLLMTDSEKQLLLEEARSIYGDKSDIELEEILANQFMEYTLNRETSNLGKRIINFFKSLFTKLVHWKNSSLYMNNYFRMINDGKYANKSIPKLNTIDNTFTTFESLESTVQEDLTNKGWTSEFFNSISEEEKQQALYCL